jgi:phosphoglucomutase
MDFPATSNVLQFYTEDGTKVSVRPSGTEPKIKFYIEVRDTLANADDYDRANADALKKIDAIKADLGI